MTTYLLDTNACIALINGDEPGVRRRFQRAVARESVVLLSSIVAFELWYGMAKSQRKDSNRRRLEAFFAGPLEWTPFDEGDAEAAGAVRAELEAAGKPIGAYDVLLAGQARRRGATLVTSNAREFVRVAGLRCEDWGVSRRGESTRAAASSARGAGRGRRARTGPRR
jgi:tRNA(fMet)-specific endonuclease VapC